MSSVLSLCDKEGIEQLAYLRRPVMRTISDNSTVPRIYPVTAGPSTGVGESLSSSEACRAGRRRVGRVRKYEKKAKKGG